MPIKIFVKGREFYDDVSDEMFSIESATLELEHSLISLRKWESKWKVSFMNESNNKRLTKEQLTDYYKCMSLKPVKNELIFQCISYKDEQKILEYISDSMTATTIKQIVKEGKSRRAKKNDIVTVEIIYYWMVELGIPFECEKWHLNQLLTLIQVCDEKQAVPKKMKDKDVLGMYAAANAKRRAQSKAKR